MEWFGAVPPLNHAHGYLTSVTTAPEKTLYKIADSLLVDAFLLECIHVL